MTVETNMERLKLSSKQAKMIKALKIKKFRQQERLFIVEGKKNVLELLSSKFKIKFLVGTNTYFETIKGKVALDQSKCLLASPSELSSLGTLSTNNDCIAVVEYGSEDESDNHSDHMFLFDGINDPGNLGTIIRTLDWFGYNHLICSRETTDHYSPKVVNTSKGSFFRTKIEIANLEEVIARSSRKVYLVEMNGKPISTLNSEVLQPSIFVMGSESHGISNALKALGSESITIPSFGSAESLNVGIATGILCYQLRLT
ncbi:MAG: RNA methyltransferase [Cyclobacteriaceae bacterium]